MPTDALWLECEVRGDWSVELGAWVIGLLAHACRGACDDMLVVVRDLYGSARAVARARSTSS